MSHSLRSWRLLVGTLLGLVCLWLVARDVSWLEVGRALRAADYRLLALAAVLVVAATGIRAWCWRRIYGPTPRPTTFIRAWRILLVAQFLNIGVPARVGDVARVYLIGEAGQFSKTAAATSLVIEKFFDMIALLLMLFLIATQTDLPPTLDEAAFGLAVATVALALVVVALAWKSDRLVPILEARVKGAQGWFRRALEQLVTVLDSVRMLRRWPAALGIQVGYVAGWVALGLATYVVLVAVGLSLPPVAAIVVLGIVQLGTAVPSTPGKVGVFQFLSVAALTPFGVPDTGAFTYGVLLHVVSYVPVVMLGGVGLWLELPGLRRARVVS